MKQAKRFVAKIMIVPLVVALCAGLVTMEATAAPQGKPIVIGASLPITGGFAINGQKHKNGYQLWEKLVNARGGLLGRPVKVLINDNQSSVEASLSQIERYINVDKVDLLLGTFSSKLTFPMSAIAEQAKMVYPIPSGGALKIYERGFKYIFFFQPTAAEYVGNSVADMILHYVPAGERPKTVAVAWADDFFSNAISAGMLGKKVEITGFNKVIDLAPGTLSKAGMKVVFAKQWPEEYSDWITLANSIKASRAEYLAGLVAFPDEVIMLSRALKTVGFQPKGAYFCQGTQEEVKEGLGDSVNGITIHSAWHPAVQWEGLIAGEKLTNQDFVELFKKEFGHEPDEDEAIPFATCQGLEQAVQAVGSTDNTAMRNWIASRDKQNPIKTVLGDFYFDERGLAKDKPFLMAQWQDGKLKFVYPVGQFPGTTDLVWPKPKW